MAKCRVLHLLMSVVLLLLLCVTLVRAYAEEPLTFRDPYSREVTDEEISTIHDDLTVVLALAAGFTQQDAITLEIWNQLVDAEQLGPGAAISYTNCLGSFYPMPDPPASCAVADRRPVAWPLWDKVKDPSCATSRFGPYSPFFHFPRATPQELGALHDWGWGITTTLTGYAAYAWGAQSVLHAPCVLTETVIITTGIAAGSLPAFATYLHALADSVSHRECIRVMDALGAPWATHTASGVFECDYIPAHPTNDDAHGREFGTRYITDSLRTEEAIWLVYEELVQRSLAREGIHAPLGLDEPLPRMEGRPTLRQALQAFVHTWEFDQASARRSYADQLVRAILQQRQPVLLPLVLRP
jgi:hypothetical protein